MRITVFLSILLWPLLSVAGSMGEAPKQKSRSPFYIGGNIGYGSTTWKGLVPNVENQNIVLNISTPTSVNEGGVVYGGAVGYELIPHFAIEANYLDYPDATIFFDEGSLFAFENDGLTWLHTQTEAVTLMAKFMFTIPSTDVRAYSSIGGGGIHRKDNLNDTWLMTPSFGVGLLFPLSEHFIAEFSGNYMAGYGESELNPVEDFIPFLYAAYFRLIYHF